MAAWWRHRAHDRPDLDRACGAAKGDRRRPYRGSAASSSARFPAPRL